MLQVQEAILVSSVNDGSPLGFVVRALHPTHGTGPTNTGVRE